MGKVSLCAAGTDKYGVAVAEVPDTHPSEATIIYSSCSRPRGSFVGNSSPVLWACLAPVGRSFGFGAPSPAGKKLVLYEKSTWLITTRLRSGLDHNSGGVTAGSGTRVLGRITVTSAVSKRHRCHPCQGGGEGKHR